MGDVALPVQLAFLQARSSERGVEIAWRTLSELNNVGFHVYRSTRRDGEYVRVTRELIRGQGTEITSAGLSAVEFTCTSYVLGPSVPPVAR